MSRDVRGGEDDLYLDTVKPFEVTIYQEAAIEAREKGDFELACEFYHDALDTISEYRENIAEIREEAALTEEDQKQLEEIEDSLDKMENGLEQQLIRIQ